MYQGAVIQGNLCVEVPKDETDLLIYYKGGYYSPALWLQASQPDSIEALRDVSAKVVTDSSVDIGTQSTNPMTAGSTNLTDNGLGITVMSVDADAWPEVYAENMFNDPPKAGYRFLMVKLEVENSSGASGQIRIRDSDFKVVGSSAVLAGTCGLYPVIPNELDIKVSTGEKLSGNVCVEVGNNEVDFILNYDKYWMSLGTEANKPG